LRGRADICLCVRDTCYRYFRIDSTSALHPGCPHFSLRSSCGNRRLLQGTLVEIQRIPHHNILHMSGFTSWPRHPDRAGQAAFSALGKATSSAVMHQRKERETDQNSERPDAPRLVPDSGVVWLRAAIGPHWGGPPLGSQHLLDAGGACNAGQINNILHPCYTHEISRATHGGTASSAPYMHVEAARHIPCSCTVIRSVRCRARRCKSRPVRHVAVSRVHRQARAQFMSLSWWIDRGRRRCCGASAGQRCVDPFGHR
jgi:hypothetical protein